MVAWHEFERDAPELSKLAKERFAATELVMLGTLKKDGWPRISPIEFSYFDDELVLGGMWQSKKFLDLMRDPRCTIHSTTRNKNGKEGDIKLYGRVRPFPEERLEPFWQNVFATTGWRPSGPAHVYRFDVESGSYTRFEADSSMRWLTWPGNEWRSKKSE